MEQCISHSTGVPQVKYKNMICPNCAVQMHQHKEIGGGVAKDELYQTWEIKKCPNCGRMVKELYQCEIISQAKVDKLLKERDVEIIPVEME